MESAKAWVDTAESILVNNVEVTVGVALVLLVLAGGAGWYVLTRRRSPAAALQSRLASRESVAVLMHPNPDPDAMASALGVKYLAEDVGTDATLQYPGEIRHHENRAFRTVLDLDFEQVRETADLAADAVVLVDHNVPRGFDGARRVDPFAVVDHHPGDGTGSAYTDVRPDYGACASIVAEYFEDLGADRRGPADEELEGAERLVLPSTVATGLVYGIQSDTNNLRNGCSAADFDAYTYLYPGIDDDCLERIANPLVDAEVIDVKRQAIEERDCRPPFAISDVGSVDNLDALPQAADDLIRVEDSTAVIVMGDKDGTLHLSGRSRDDRVHMGRTLQMAVEDIPMADAGGHARMGGGQVSLAHMNGIGPSKGLSRADFHDQLFAAMAGEA